jgi:hypothetical protein
MRVMNTLKPCSYCGHTSFNYVPNVAMDYGHLTTVLGMPARQGDHWWVVTLVICTQCGNTLTFTTNAQQLCARVPDTKVIHADGR